MSNPQSEDAFVCPSFSSYSSDRLSEIAGRVAVERSDAAAAAGDDDFEFSFMMDDDGEVLAEDFFRDGRIRQVFPVLKRRTCDDGESDPTDSVPISLSELFIEENRQRDYPPSCSSSASEVDDEIESVPTETYCVWRPKAASAADPPMPSQCEKSKSTGSASRRWKLLDLMRRSKSDGKDVFVFLPAKGKSGRSSGRVLRPASGGAGAGGLSGMRSAHEEFYVRNKAMKEGDKKKSYLPYRQVFVGVFANVNGLSGGRLAY